MKIELGQRLSALRKENNFSQEDIAERLGVSRQAISNWERGESSPDTENLIELSMLYNVSVDELIFGKKETNETEKKSGEDDAEGNNNTAESTEESKPVNNVHIGFDGIKVYDEKNKTTVDIGLKGIHVSDGGNNQEVHIDKNHILVNGEDKKPNIWIHAVFPIAVFFIYMTVSLLVKDIWYCSWLILSAIPIIGSLYDAVKEKNPERFAYPFLVIAVFLAIGLIAKIWHPTWVIFITIPMYYMICSIFKSKEK